ncbi:hypothetical protein CDD83_11251 [Cordyceps sp. RAO-2017]|nr:hypothetical protein CDD83_11251 [Cordyceps sp. RAO-2017]
MSSSSEDSGSDRLPAPFLLQLFYRTGAFQRPDEFAAESLPPHISIYTWPDCTLSELAMELAASNPSALPYPAVGTRLAFQLVYPDIRGAVSGGNASPRYAAKDLGSIVIGQGGPGADTASFGDSNNPLRGDQEVGRTLDDARFVVGDFVSCAILPPPSDGSVAPASGARRDAGYGMRDARFQRGGYAARENGFGRGAGAGAGSRGLRAGRRDGIGGGARLPMGEWRRGEALPEMPPARPRGSGGRW